MFWGYLLSQVVLRTNRKCSKTEQHEWPTCSGASVALCLSVYLWMFTPQSSKVRSLQWKASALTSMAAVSERSPNDIGNYLAPFMCYSHLLRSTVERAWCTVDLCQEGIYTVWLLCRGNYMEGSHWGVWVFRILIQCLKKAKSPGRLTHETLTHLGGPHLEGCRVLDSLKITLTGVIRNREHTEIPFLSSI